MFGFFFPGRYLVAALPVAAGLVAWGMRSAPRTAAVLTAVTLLTSVWWYAGLRIGGGAITEAGGPGSRVPLGPLADALPRFGTGSAGETIALAAVGAGLVALAALEWRARRTRHDLA
jgi:hypothetical protein